MSEMAAVRPRLASWANRVIAVLDQEDLSAAPGGQELSGYDTIEFLAIVEQAREPLTRGELVALTNRIDRLLNKLQEGKRR